MTPHLTREQILNRLEQLNENRPYAAMYSSVFGGIVTDRAMMLIPIDEHMVHRGDGIFEAVRSTAKGFYLLREHLERLERSAAMIDLRLPMPAAEIAAIAGDLHRISKLDRGILRIFVGRGPGDFSPNPYNTIASQLYMVMTRQAPTQEEKYERGSRLCFSNVAVKPGLFSRVKSCNYLPNVMMKKESVDRGFDYAINRTEDGRIAEGPTENILVWTKMGDLIAPNFDYTLRGTTLVRVMDLARKEFLAGARNVADGKHGESIDRHGREPNVRSIQTADLRDEDLISAREVMMVGTTTEVISVIQIEDHTIADGRVGPLARRLRELLRHDVEMTATGDFGLTV